MTKKKTRGIFGGLLMLFLIAFISVSSWAANRDAVENPLLRSVRSAKPAVADEVIVDVGLIHSRVTNNTVLPGGTNEWTIILGDDTSVLPSMTWLYPSIYTNNLYLYFATVRVGKGEQLVHFSTDTSPGMETTSINTDPSAVSHLDTYFEISDNSPLVSPTDYIGIKAHAYSYAWSETYRDDFIIHDYWFLNLNPAALEDIYIALHADCDVSGAAGGSDLQGFWRDDLIDYYRNDATKEYISYMYDSDNTSIAGDDTGGKFLPKESTGYIGSRLLYCPPIMGSTEESVQSGHGWWDWNSDPGEDSDWMLLMTDGLWLDPPPSPHDFRFLQKLGPFEIPAGDSIRVVLALGIGEGLDGLRANLAWADSLFKLDWVGPSAPSAPVFIADPGDRVVELTWETNAETAPDPATGLIDFEGYRVWRKTGEGGSWTLLMECDLINDIGFNTGLVHSYSDTDVNNGFQYYYVVTAYDRGEPENGIESFESGRGGAVAVEPGLNSLTSGADRTGIHVVPNPFVKTSPAGFGFTPDINNPSEERIQFVNLPEEPATVTVYSLTGDEIIVLEKPVTERRVSWDLITKSTQKIVAGVYLFVVESDGLDENFIGKFMVVR
ncbi:MAG: T9SS type A sorting domain-containing protein [Candidatus Zixiibacteriota bacterium]|nr:MAG: T9SS type A sorting domain-containing protein [candidate division Zixibacteria bacterium]